MGDYEVKKVFYLILKDLPHNSALFWHDIQIRFENRTGEQIQDHLDVVKKVIGELHDEKILRIDDSDRSFLRIWKGINFENLESEFNSRSKNSHISINSLNAQHVQVGNENQMNINITAEQFSSALLSLASKPQAETKSIVEKVASFVGSGATLAEAISKLVGLTRN